MIDLKSVYRISLINRLFFLSRQEHSCLTLKFIVLKPFVSCQPFQSCWRGFLEGNLWGCAKPVSLTFSNTYSLVWQGNLPDTQMDLKQEGYVLHQGNPTT